MEKKIPVWVLVLVVFLWINFTVLFGGLVRHVDEGGVRLGKLGPVVIMIARYPSLVKAAFVETFGRSPLLIDNRWPEIDGFKKNGVLKDGALKDIGYLLLSAYDKSKKQSTVKLIRIGNQQVMHEWVPNIPELVKSQHTESPFFTMHGMQAPRYQMNHPLLLDDGGIIFQNSGPLFKINVCSNMEWEIDGIFHHSIEQDIDGNFWVPSIIEPASYDKAKFAGYRDDAIAKVSPDGKVLFKRSVSKILEENGYSGLLFGAGPYEKDTIHLNDIQPAVYSTKYWEKGDLLLSIRNRSTVFLYRPSTNKIIWLKTGPWLNQHDPDFIGQSKISIFGDDLMRGGVAAADVLIEGHNNIYLFDFTDGSISTPYAEALKKFNVRTNYAGRQDILENSDVFVEETNYGRILRLSAKQAIWEFTVKVDDKTIGAVSWSRYLTKEQVKNALAVLEKTKCR